MKYFDWKQWAVRHLGLLRICVLRHKWGHSSFFSWQPGINMNQNLLLVAISNFELTKTILNNIWLLVSNLEVIFIRLTTLLTLSKRQLIRLRINPWWRPAHCFQSKYFQNQARCQKSVKYFRDNYKRSFKSDNKNFCKLISKFRWVTSQAWNLRNEIRRLKQVCIFTCSRQPIYGLF